MRDRVERLEALSRLHAAGSLNAEEFAAEKARILAEDRTPAPRPTRLRPKRAALALTAVVVAIGAAWFGSGLVPADETAPRTVPGARSAAVPAPPPPLPAPKVAPPAEAIAMDSTFRFSSPSECIAGGELATVFRRLDQAMEKGSASDVESAALPDPIPVTARSGTDRDGTWTASASIRLPERTYWHSLRLSRVAAEWVRPPEVDSLYGRAITFLAPPAEVLAVLNRLGFEAKAAPAYSELPDTYNSCGGAMEVKAVPGGTSLSCGWGC